MRMALGARLLLIVFSAMLAVPAMASRAAAQQDPLCINCDPGGEPPVYAVAVTPDGGTFGTVPTNKSGLTLSFTVKNTGNHATEFYNLSCSGTNGITCSPNTLSVGLSPGTSRTVTVTFSTGSTSGPGRVTLTAMSSNSTNSGYYTGTIVRYGVSVTPDGSTAPTRKANTGGYSQTFTIKNTGETSNTYTFTCTGSGGVICGTAPSPVTLAPDSSTTRTQSYSVGAPGTGKLTLTATGSNASNSGYYNVPIVSYGVSVTPDGTTTPTRKANTGGYSQTFTIKNTGSTSNTFTFTCTGSGGVTCGTAPSSVTLAAGASTTRTQSYSVGAPGTGKLTLTATGSNASNSGYYNVPIVSYGVSVTPDGATASATPYSSGSLTFTIKNTGSASNTFTFTCSSTGGVTCGTAPAPVTLAAGQSITRDQSYSVGGPGTGTLTLTASGSNAANSGSYSVQITAVDDPFQSKVSGGAFTKDSRYVLQETANDYDAYGRIERLTDARGKVTKYAYGGTNGAFLTRITRLADAGSSVDSLTTVLTYYEESGYLKSIKDEGGSSRSFVYDGFGRLIEIKNHADSVVEEYAYQYSRKSENGWTFDSASPNVITTTTYLQHSPSVKSVVKREYLDGLGRTIQTNVQDGSTYHVTATEYDAMGRPRRAWKPYPRTSPDYDVNFALHAAAWYDTVYDSNQAKPYRETQYTADALSRVKREIPEYIGGSAPDTVLYVYGVDGANDWTYTEVTDESGKKVRRYKDLFGNEVKVVLGYGATEATTTTLAYDVLGRRTRATDPRGLVTTYTLDGRGLLTQKTSPDAGTVKHKYDRAGNLRYTQDANQAAAGQVHFTTYDFAGRPLTSGVGPATFSSLDPDAATAPSLETTTANWRTVWQYDAKPSPTLYPWSLFSAQIEADTLLNVTGRLAAVASRSNGAWQVELYSYDADGRIVRRYVHTQPNSGTGVLMALNTRTVYVRDLRGSITERHDYVGTRAFHHWYEYDGRGLLWKVYADTSATRPDTPDVVYTYRPSGEVASRQYA
ncbi:MAG TPA: DUF6443 domain-containing protein, partial [Longimicrobiales bacterium]